jgi:hypothetical protein
MTWCISIRAFRLRRRSSSAGMSTSTCCKRDRTSCGCGTTAALRHDGGGSVCQRRNERRVREMQEQSALVLDNESKERALVGEVISTVALARQISREFTVSDHGIDMEIEFKDDGGEATGKKLYLQLKSGDSYLRRCYCSGRAAWAVLDGTGVSGGSGDSELGRGGSMDGGAGVAACSRGHEADCVRGRTVRRDERKAMAGSGVGFAVEARFATDRAVLFLGLVHRGRRGRRPRTWGSAPPWD